jgi:hypothetical protein
MGFSIGNHQSAITNDTTPSPIRSLPAAGDSRLGRHFPRWLMLGGFHRLYAECDQHRKPDNRFRLPLRVNRAAYLPFGLDVSGQRVRFCC